MENHCLENRPASTSFSCLVNVSLGKVRSRGSSARGGGGGGGGSSTSDGGASSGDGGGCGGGSSSLACSCGTMQRAGMRPNEIRVSFPCLDAAEESSSNEQDHVPSKRNHRIGFSSFLVINLTTALPEKWTFGDYCVLLEKCLVRFLREAVEKIQETKSKEITISMFLSTNLVRPRSNITFCSLYHHPVYNHPVSQLARDILQLMSALRISGTSV
uniref:Uncharacterized protein n=1 Tax=Vespula pensylvanica TaxID=30213 RepID=A0A834PHA9_VESPE|nr:hypothetical protein H0235_001557 [Vespula pensylvanica]